MTFNSLTENEERDIPSHILKTIFGLHASVIFRPKYVWFPVHLKDAVIPDPSGQLTELIGYITSTRVDLYSHQILLPRELFDKLLGTVPLRALNFFTSEWNTHNSRYGLYILCVISKHTFEISHKISNPFRYDFYTKLKL